MTTRTLLLADAAFEAVLAAVLVAGVGAGWLSGDDFATSTGAVVAFAGVLAAFALGLAWLATRAARAGLLALALVNDVTACAGLGWLIVSRGFSAAGAVLVAVTVACLFGLSSLQLRASITRRFAS